MMRWNRLFVLLIGALASTAWADSDYERRTLAGLRGVHVVVHQPDSVQARAGLAPEDLRAEIEEPLRAAGVPILNAEESRLAPGVPWLQLLVGVTQVEKKNLYAWSMRLVLLQRTCMERDPKICESSTTWSASSFGTVGSFQRKSIRADARALGQLFATAYWSVNTK
jgi:hypothetical protein